MKKIGILFLMSAFFACSEEFKHAPTGGDSNAPEPLKSAQVKENIAGGAVITYELPDNSDALYVKAVYTTSQGVEKDVIASSYLNSLTIKGLGNTNARTVKLYVVNRQEKTSAPMEVTINPLTPPVQKIKNSLTYTTDFGGFLVTYDNEDREDVSINVLARDSTGTEMLDYDALYTPLAVGQYAVRGLPDTENRFGLYVRDRWDNISDTVFFTLTPWREDYLDKLLFRHIVVAGDYPSWTNYGGTVGRLWDGLIFTDGDNYGSTLDGPLPHRLTIDLGVSVKLSRFKLWQRAHEVTFYQHAEPKHYKVYGRLDDPGQGNAADVMEGWTLLRECHSFKPSGLPLGQVSNEDWDYMKNGEEYLFPLDAAPVQYVRLEFLESWSGRSMTNFGEISFWGTIQ
ncbi:DUF5000 domain-containing lipoprotein [Candidatus Symbiothrix dinenymphae]|uniref:DUF5000 domain-containing lipoprotein n=1 Tax=Candidatus Symbiothrix dinenymphae TaxID=467085 RepID=UPI0009E9E259|nr:DUF5000 domain-containing lipoprotein [Candidatus Symbiothrix dinenymphae]